MTGTQVWHSPPPRPASLLRLSLLALAPLLLTSPSASAQGPLEQALKALFGGNRVQEAAVEVQVGPEAAAPFLPLVKKAAARELYFANKVCQCDDAQYNALRLAAADAANKLALEYGRRQHKHESTETWPAPRPYLTAALLKAAEKALPPDKTEALRREFEAREQADRDACQAMMTRSLDTRLTLLPDQYEPLQQAVAKSWNDRRNANLTSFVYDEYLELPATRDLAPVLNDRQEAILSNKQNHGRIHFGWEQDLGFQSLNDNGLQLDGLDELAAELDRVEGDDAAKKRAVEGETVKVEEPAPAVVEEAP